MLHFISCGLHLYDDTVKRMLTFARSCLDSKNLSVLCHGMRRLSYEMAYVTPIRQ